MIYLDNAATTKIKSEVVEAMLPYLKEQWYNPSSLYGNAVKVKKDIEKARSTIGNFIGADGKEIFITSSGSEGNCWVIQGFANYYNSIGKTVTIITSTIEHKSILECVKHINANVHYVDVDEFGFIDIEMLEDLIRNAYNKSNKILVSIQFASNEVGTVQDIIRIARLVHKYNGVLHTDAVQAIGQIPINVKELDIDLLTCSGHKIGAPKGIGFLYKRNGVEIAPLIYGSQMDFLHGGTENVPYIIGLSKAIEWCDVSQEAIDELCKVRNYFINLLESRFDCELNGDSYYRLPNNINVTFPQNITGEALLYTLDLSGIQISVGSACNSHSIEPSYVLKAIGLSNDEAMRTIRITLSDDITYDEIDYVIEEIDKAIKLIEI